MLEGVNLCGRYTEVYGCGGFVFVCRFMGLLFILYGYFIGFYVIFFSFICRLVFCISL